MPSPESLDPAISGSPEIVPESALTGEIDPVDVEVDLGEDVLQRKAFQRLDAGDLLRSLGETQVQHPSDDVLDVTSQRMTHTRVHVVLRHSTVERHVGTGGEAEGIHGEKREKRDGRGIKGVEEEGRGRRRKEWEEG